MTLAARLSRSKTRIHAIAGVWLWQAVLALVATWPAASLARAAEAGDPSGDAWLWRPGARALLAFLARDAHGVQAALDAAALVLVVATVAGLVPMAMLLLAVERPDRARLALRSLAGRALRFFPPLSLLLVVFALVQAALAGAGFFVASVTANVSHESLGEARAEQLGVVVGLVFLAGAAVLGVVHDLARAAVVRTRVSAFRGLAAGTRAFLLGPGALVGGWAWRSAAALVPLGIAAAVLHFGGGHGLAALIFAAVVHQLVVLVRLGLRASWLGCAVRAVVANAEPR